MKRFLCIILSGILAASLLGCSPNSLTPSDTHKFYYRHAEFQYGIENSVIESEQRDVSGHAGDLFYLITLYLSGPLDETLISPFPSSTRLLSVEKHEKALLITLTDSGVSVLDSEYSLACVCLALTCMEFPDFTQVTIQNQSRSITLSREQLTLFDTTSHQQTVSEETQ